MYVNHLKTKRRLLYLKRPSPDRAVNTFHLGYKNQSVYAVSDTSRCLFSDKHKTRKYSVDRAYSCWMLNWLMHHVTSRLQKVNQVARPFGRLKFVKSRL